MAPTGLSPLDEWKKTWTSVIDGLADSNAVDEQAQGADARGEEAEPVQGEDDDAIQVFVRVNEDTHVLDLRARSTIAELREKLGEKLGLDGDFPDHVPLTYGGLPLQSADTLLARGIVNAATLDVGGGLLGGGVGWSKPKRIMPINDENSDRDSTNDTDTDDSDRDVSIEEKPNVVYQNWVGFSVIDSKPVIDSKSVIDRKPEIGLSKSPFWQYIPTTYSRNIRSAMEAEDKYNSWAKNQSNSTTIKQLRVGLDHLDLAHSEYTKALMHLIKDTGPKEQSDVDPFVRLSARLTEIKRETSQLRGLADLDEKGMQGSFETQALAAVDASMLVNELIKSTDFAQRSPTEALLEQAGNLGGFVTTSCQILSAAGLTKGVLDFKKTGTQRESVNRIFASSDDDSKTVNSSDKKGGNDDQEAYIKDQLTRRYEYQRTSVVCAAVGLASSVGASVTAVIFPPAAPPLVVASFSSALVAGEQSVERSWNGIVKAYHGEKGVRRLQQACTIVERAKKAWRGEGDAADRRMLAVVKLVLGVKETTAPNQEDDDVKSTSSVNKGDKAPDDKGSPLAVLFGEGSISNVVEAVFHFLQSR